jgi:programmed cell death protein 5
MDQISPEDYQKLVQKQQIEVIKKAALLRYMTKEARERLNRVKMVKPEIAEKVEMALIQALQMGQIKNRLSDEQLKEILEEVTHTKNFNLKICKK